MTNRLVELALESEKTIKRYQPYDSYARLYDKYRHERRIAQADKLNIGDGFTLEVRNRAAKKCKRLLYKLTHVRTYQTLIESNEILKLALSSAKMKKNVRFTVSWNDDDIFYQEDVFHDDFKSEGIFAILRVIAGVIQLANREIEPYAFKLGKAKEVIVDTKAYKQAKKLEAILEEAGCDVQGSNKLPFLSHLKRFLYPPVDIYKDINAPEKTTVVVEKHKAGYRIPPTKKQLTKREILVRQATLLSRHFLWFEGKNRFPAEAIHFILKYIDGSNVDKRSIQKIQSRYDQEIIDGYYDEGRDELARAFRVIPRKHSGNAT